MDLRQLDDLVSASPMLLPEDMEALARLGVATVICNRPDAEVGPAHQAAAMQAAAEAAGLSFTYNPVSMPNLTLEAVEEQADAVDGAGGPVVAYCASGTRSAVLWAFAMAGRTETDAILAATASAGFPLEGLRGQIEALAARAAAGD